MGHERLQHLAGVRPRGRFLVIDVRRDRQTDEQGGLVRIVVGQLDAHRQPLDDLDEVARGVLRRQQGQGLPGAHREAGDAALELVPAAVHVHLELDALADAQVGQLRFLEVGVDPDFRERADGHQALPHLDVVAGVDVAAGHHAVDVAEDVAVAEIQFGLGQIVFRLEELGLGLLDGRRLANQVVIDTIQIALGVLLVESSMACFGSRPTRSGSSRVGRRSEGFGQRLADGGEVLIEVGRHLGRGRGPSAAGQEGRG